MTFKTAAAGLALAALALSACTDPNAPMAANKKICANFKPTEATAASGALSLPAAAGVDSAAPVDECLRRWAYSLASSGDEAPVVADAAVAACGAQLTRWNQTSLAAAPAPDAAQGMSLTTGQPSNPVSEHYAFAQARSLFYVVQARAGRCAAPPAANGAPTGI